MRISAFRRKRKFNLLSSEVRKYYVNGQEALKSGSSAPCGHRTLYFNPKLKEKRQFLFILRESGPVTLGTDSSGFNRKLRLWASLHFFSLGIRPAFSAPPPFYLHCFPMSLSSVEAGSMAEFPS